MAAEVTIARESGAAPLNAQGRAQRGSTAKVNKALEKLTSKYRAAEGDELERMYRTYGDMESAEYKKGGELEVYFVSKAYGDGGRTRGEIPILSDAEYKDAAPRERYNPFRREYSYSQTTNEYAANSLARFVNKNGGKVKRITYIEDRD